VQEYLMRVSEGAAEKVPAPAKHGNNGAH
jgi:hypothetical protein